ncbi:nitroreductase family protein [Aliidiomarina soli]|uniref:Putative NAD(P)H nitroreductase n=1 Tax=Aliidiomarina soli TaxID=1928574 RepID=A0A432WMF7_9GAMM|nr:nitroreductase family protein [Aliidiomarina soli]RUO35000.1 nitroreductase [Aliidiomarina soli]
MQAIDLLTQRSSMPRLIAPAPDEAALQLIQRAALRVPDHMNLLPFRCQLLAGDELVNLGLLFQRACEQESGFNLRDRERAGQLPLRAPLIIVVSTDYKEHPAVPRQEQFASAACATMAMQQACFALDYGAIWRTGSYAESTVVKKGLGIRSDNDLVGFLYVGTPAVPTPIKPEREASLLQWTRLKLDE